MLALSPGSRLSVIAVTDTAFAITSWWFIVASEAFGTQRLAGRGQRAVPYPGDLSNVGMSTQTVPEHASQDMIRAIETASSGCGCLWIPTGFHYGFLPMHAGPWKEPSGERLFPRYFKLYLLVTANALFVDVSTTHLSL